MVLGIRDKITDSCQKAAAQRRARGLDTIRPTTATISEDEIRIFLQECEEEEISVHIQDCLQHLLDTGDPVTMFGLTFNLGSALAVF
jgi:hypothetical protein